MTDGMYVFVRAVRRLADGIAVLFWFWTDRNPLRSFCVHFPDYHHFRL
jgi:hypothetical protein